MRLSLGRLPSGDDFFDRTRELQLLEGWVSSYSHVLLTGESGIGKTSIACELGRQLEAKGWVFVFASFGGAEKPEDAVAIIAEEVRLVLSLWSRLITKIWKWFGNIVRVGSPNHPVKFSPEVNDRNWRRKGTQFIRDCAKHPKPVFLVIDQLPEFLDRLSCNNAQQAERFLRWFLSVLQIPGSSSNPPAAIPSNGIRRFCKTHRRSGNSLAIILPSSMDLAPLMQQLGLSDCVNHFHCYPLGPWSRKDSIGCFEHLATSNRLQIDDGVAAVVCDKLGTDIPRQVQSFFARLQEFSIMERRERVTVKDVSEVYNSKDFRLAEQNNFEHYETHRKDTLDGDRDRKPLERRFPDAGREPS